MIFVVAALFTVTSAFDYEEEWQGFKSQFGKKYSSDLEELTRHEIFESNMKYIEEHNKNADKHGFTLGVNEYADLVSLLSIASSNRSHRNSKQLGAFEHDL